MKKHLLTIGIAVLLIFNSVNLFATSSSISGTYTNYTCTTDTLLVVGNCTVTTGTLNIPSGTHVIFTGDYELIARIVAEGTETDSIYFENNDIIPMGTIYSWNQGCMACPPVLARAQFVSVNNLAKVQITYPQYSSFQNIQYLKVDSPNDCLFTNNDSITFATDIYSCNVSRTNYFD